MSFFRYGRDYYADAAAQQLLSSAAGLFFALAGLFVAAHLLRRSFGYPVSTDPAVKLPANMRVTKYKIGARLYHWANTIAVLSLAVSAIPLFAPGSLGPGPWLLIHELGGAAFIVLLALHIVVAPRRGSGRSMWFARRDVRDLRVIATNFLGRTREYPAFGKYDPLQKVYHAVLTVVAAGLVVTGVYLLLSAEAWSTFSHAWMRAMRLIHDVAGFAFVAFVAGHVYFSLIRVNWPQLVSMCIGRLRGSSFNVYHDAQRWNPLDD